MLATFHYVKLSAKLQHLCNTFATALLYILRARGRNFSSRGLGIRKVISDFPVIRVWCSVNHKLFKIARLVLYANVHTNVAGTSTKLYITHEVVEFQSDIYTAF